MTQQASSAAETLASAAPLDTTAGLTPRLPQTAGPRLADEAGSTQVFTNIQETLQQYLQERFRALELQLILNQQRQCDLVDEEIHKIRQQLATNTQEYHQHQQTVSATLRETIEQMRKAFSDVLLHATQDIEQALRQSEEQTRRALEKLRDDVRQMFFERDQMTVKRQTLGELLIALGKQLQKATEEESA
jgi:flagellar hook-basal body complex protein FliE